MPEKYELFLDKNKKVKLSADEQGNFFAEANDKKIKLGSNGLENVDVNGVVSPVGNDLTTLDQSIIPDTNQVYDLGSAEKKFRHLYLSSNSLFVGDTKITSDPTTGALTTSVADEQGVFGASSAVGPENISGSTDTVNIEIGNTWDGSGTFNHVGGSANAPNEHTISFSPFNNTGLFIMSSAFTGRSFQVGQELGFAEKGFRFEASFPNDIAEAGNGDYYFLYNVIFPGNAIGDTVNYGTEHGNTADLRWYFVQDYGHGSLAWELRNKNTNVPVNLSDVYLSAKGENLSTGAFENLQGGVQFTYLLDQWQSQGNISLSPDADYTPPGFGSPPAMEFPNNVIFDETQSNVTITGNLNMTFDGVNYKLTRNSSSGAVETTAI